MNDSVIMMAALVCVAGCPGGQGNANEAESEVSSGGVGESSGADSSTSNGSIAPEGDTSSGSGAGDGTAGAESETSEGVVCGDGVVEGSEVCDDGVNDGGYGGCNPDCGGLAAYCGDGVTNGGEECDDGDLVDTNECTTGCLTARCGDGYTWAGVEECDDGNEVSTDGCVEGCLLAACGDGFVESGSEECDDGNVLPDDGCDPGCDVELNLVFVSGNTYTGDMGGIAGADANCQSLASAAGLPGTYLAWLSTGETSPAARFVKSPEPYYTPTGVKIADSWADLTDGSLDAPIDVTEFGGVPPVGSCSGNSVWSSTTLSGTLNDSDYTCSGWTSTEGWGRYGSHNSSNQHWTAYYGSNQPCSCQRPIYCFRQVG